MFQDREVGSRVRSSAFTLIELLVVIGIISVLISMLMPMTQKVRAHARAVVCASNMRQVYTSIIAYAQDHRDHWPDKEAIGEVGFRAGFGYDGVGSNWDTAGKSIGPEKYGLPSLFALKGYIPSGSRVWICPAQPSGFQEWGNTYSYSVAKAVVSGTSIDRSKNPDTMVLWDNYSFYPYFTGVEGKGAGSQARLGGPANSNYPHRITVKGRNGASSRSYQLLMIDGSTMLKAN